MAMTLRRHFLHLTMSTVGSLGFVRAFPSQAQDALDSLKILVGYPPGGSNDVVSRWVADKLIGNYAKAALVDNKPGAAGRVVVDVLKSLPANGKTMLLTPSSVVTLYPHIYRQLSYDPVADLTPVAVACDQVHGLAVGTTVSEQVRTVADFVAWAKANPAKANCGNPGEGSTPHLLTFMLVKASGAPIQAVPYRGLAPAVNDLISGQLCVSTVARRRFPAICRRRPCARNRHFRRSPLAVLPGGSNFRRTRPEEHCRHRVARFLHARGNFRGHREPGGRRHRPSTTAARPHRGLCQSRLGIGAVNACRVSTSAEHRPCLLGVDGEIVGLQSA